jgi:hypothetical protein
MFIDRSGAPLLTTTGALAFELAGALTSLVDAGRFGGPCGAPVIDGTTAGPDGGLVFAVGVPSGDPGGGTIASTN